MKMLSKIFVMLLLLIGNIKAHLISFELGQNPDINLCRNLFFKFHHQMSDRSFDETVVDSVLSTIYEEEISICSAGSDDIVYLQITSMHELVGYVFFQIMPDLQARVCLFALDLEKLNLDIEKIDQSFMEELFYSIFLIKPQVAGILISCPATSVVLETVFQSLGFEENVEFIGYKRDVSVEYKLPVHQKCKICEVLYGADFWEQDMALSEDGDFDPLEGGDWGSWELKDSEPKEYGFFPYDDDLD